MTTYKRDAERVTMPQQLRGEVMVFEPITILDMSERGAQVESTFALHLDSLHDFRLSLGERSVVLKGRIVHSKIGELKEGRVLYRTGVEFVEPSERVVAAIRDFVVAQKAALSRPPVIDAELAD